MFRDYVDQEKLITRCDNTADIIST